MNNCPHCKTKPDLRVARYSGWYERDDGMESRDVTAWQVKCPNCSLAGPEAATQEEAVAVWDRLAMPSYADIKDRAEIEELLEIARAYDAATKKHHGFPADILHMAAILAEEAGEVVKAALDHVYKSSPLGDVRTEAAQVGAVALRMLLHLNECRAIKSEMVGA